MPTCLNHYDKTATHKLINNDIVGVGQYYYC